MTRTIAETAALLDAKRLSPVELAREHLARIAGLDPALHAFIRVTEGARPGRCPRGRGAADGRHAARAGWTASPSRTKDIYATAGIPTTAHSAQLRDHVPAEDAATVAKLAEAGVVLLGKLSTHEFAFGGPSHDLPWPVAENPWGAGHFTAGSSSGTGAAVASGMILGRHGQRHRRLDPRAGGAVRHRGHQADLRHVLAHGHPAAGADARPRGPDGLDERGLRHPARSHGRPRSGRPGQRRAAGAALRPRRRVARPAHRRDPPLPRGRPSGQPATLRGIAESCDILRGLGAEVAEVTLPSLAEFNAVGWVTLMGEAWAVHEDWMRRRPHLYGEFLRGRLALGGLLSAGDYIQAQRRRRSLAARSAAAMAGFDLLITAAVPGEAPRIAEVSKWASLEKPGFTIPFNLLGWPAMSVCTGFGEKGLPVAAQIVAGPGRTGWCWRPGSRWSRPMAIGPRVTAVKNAEAVQVPA
jgi:aspartyl-tRNA(Asn)/glutamyl-tRNA(Gln) amidotransferase subunit A